MAVASALFAFATGFLQRTRKISASAITHLAVDLAWVLAFAGQ